MIESLFPKIFSLLSIFFIIVLGVIVIKNGTKLVNKLFALLSVILVAWVFGSFMMFSSTTDLQIIFWDRFVYAFIIFWAVIQYHFSLAVTNFTKKRKILLIIGYIIFVIFLILSRTSYFVKDIFHYAWGAHMQAQIAHHIFIIFFSFYVLLFFYVLLKKYYQEKDTLKKKRTLFYILGFSVLDFIGGTAFLPAYHIVIYPVFLATPLIFSIIITYSIVYFGLMNIKLIMRRYFVYFFSIAAVVTPSAIAVYNAYVFFPKLLVITFVTSYILSLLFFERIEKGCYRFANHYLFLSLYDFNELIYSLNSHLRTSLDIKKTFESVTGILTQAFHCQAIAAVNFNNQKETWSVLYNNGFSSLDIKTKELNYSVVKDIFINNLPLSSLNIYKQQRPQDAGFLAYLKSSDIELVVPIKINKTQLTSLIFFGPKESSESYDEKDLQVLGFIAGQIGVSIENSLLYESVKKFNVRLKNEIAKATKKLQIQNETLKKLDQIKDEFVGIVSHQLRTPLTGIRWLTERLIKNKDNNLDEKQLELLRHISSSNLSLIKLVNDLLDVSHIETGHKFDVIKKYFNLQELLGEVLKESIYLIETKKLVVVNDIPNTLEIYADRDKLKQVWQNLITNATKYSQDNTTIKIYYKIKGKTEIIFYVADEGIGVPKEQQSKLFGKFFRASNAALQYTEGTGLGLYIAREMIRAHGGEMSYKSIEKKGSTFYFSLPIINKNNN